MGLAMVVALGAVAVNARVCGHRVAGRRRAGRRDPHGHRPVADRQRRIRPEIAAIDGVARATPIASFDLAFDGTRLDAVAIRGSDFGG